MRNISGKIRSENQKIPLMMRNDFSKIVPFVGYCGKNIVEPDKPQMTI